MGIGGYFGMEFLSFLPETVLTIFTGISGTAIVALLLNIILPRTDEDRKEMEERALQMQGAAE